LAKNHLSQLNMSTVMETGFENESQEELDNSPDSYCGVCDTRDYMIEEEKGKFMTMCQSCMNNGWLPNPKTELKFTLDNMKIEDGFYTEEDIWYVEEHLKLISIVDEEEDTNCIFLLDYRGQTHLIYDSGIEYVFMKNEKGNWVQITN